MMCKLISFYMYSVLCAEAFIFEIKGTTNLLIIGWDFLCSFTRIIFFPPFIVLMNLLLVDLISFFSKQAVSKMSECKCIYLRGTYILYIGIITIHFCTLYPSTLRNYLLNFVKPPLKSTHSEDKTYWSF